MRRVQDWRLAGSSRVRRLSGRVGPAAAGGGWGVEELVDVPGALGGVLVEEPGAVSEERACAIADGEESNFDLNP